MITTVFKHSLRPWKSKFLSPRVPKLEQTPLTEANINVWHVLLNSRGLFLLHMLPSLLSWDLGAACQWGAGWVAQACRAELAVCRLPTACLFVSPQILPSPRAGFLPYHGYW